MLQREQRDLSVIIPAREEYFLKRTIEDVLKNKEANTEVIAILDGYWPDPPISDHPDVTIVHFTKPIGQRGATNAGARLSKAKFIMKIDAHSSYGKGFDRILMEDCRRDWTMIPSQYALHAFDWKCKGCGNRTYQGNKPELCKKCQAEDFEMVEVWERRENRLTLSWRFDNNMQFQYWRKHRKRKECQGDLIETMSCIGACFLMHRRRFLRLGGMDEAHGSWGQFGTELACKTWLSGGKMITSRKTWYAHMFRTGNFRGSGFRGSAFPYELSGNQQNH